MPTRTTKAQPGSSRKKKTELSRKNSAKTGGSVMLPGEILPVLEFMQRLGTTRYGIAGMRNRGLVLRKDGNRVVVRYDDYAEYVKNLPPA